MNKRISWISISTIAVLLLTMALAQPVFADEGNVTFTVLDSNNTPLDGVNVYYNDYSNHWVLLGATTGGNPVTATFADGVYNFKAVKDYSQQVASVVVSGTTGHTFQTDEFTVHVKDAGEAAFEGIAVAYNDYSNHYLSMGATDSAGNAYIELFPGTYTFRVTKDHSTATGSTSSAIEFQTALFTVHVVNSSGDNYQGIAIGYNDYSNHYLSMGTTDSDGNASIELFPGTYTFKATEDHTDDMSDLTNNTPGTETIVEFPTAKAIGIVKDCDGTPLAGFKVAFNDYSNHWTNMGLTGVDGMASIQLFPGIRTIRAWIDYTYEVKDLALIWPESTVEFYPTKVNFTYSGSVKYNDYSNHWKAMTSPFYLFPGTYTFMFDDVQQEVEIGGCEMSLPYGDTNQTPSVLSTAADASGDEGSVLTTSGSFSDPDGDPLTITSAGAGAITDNEDGTWSWNYTPTDNGTGSVTVTADDGKGGTVADTFEWTSYNVAPDVTITAPTDGTLYTVNTSVNLSATYTDPGSSDTHTYSINWDDLNTDTGAASGGTVSGSHSYTVPGVYTIDVTVTDDDGEFDTESVMVVVYDPSGGFVTGGGWITSPAGAYKADEFLIGKATFGFVAKYKKGANVPDGNTEFQFKAGDLNFHSTSYEWLVVAGDKAQFKGEGTVNGQGSYKFMIWADDDNPDTFRIQIWGDVGTVYDNGSQQSLGGGNIVVHQ